MICPFCQHEIDIASLSCPRCFTAYPRRGMPFGFSIRTAVTTSALLLVFSLILAECVFNYLPGGPYSTIPTGSTQLPIQPLPDLNTPALDQQLARWAAGQQNAMTAIPPSHK